MKNFRNTFFKLLFTLPFIFLVNSCAKDEPVDPCEGITCLNGGYCANGACTCPEGFTSPDCGAQITPSKIKISKIEDIKFPQRKAMVPVGISAADRIFTPYC